MTTYLSGECVNYNWYYSYEWAPTLTDIRQFQQTCCLGSRSVQQPPSSSLSSLSAPSSASPETSCHSTASPAFFFKQNASPSKGQTSSLDNRPLPPYKFLLSVIPPSAYGYLPLPLQDLVNANGAFATYFQSSEQLEYDLEAIMTAVDKIPLERFSNTEKKILFFSFVISFEWLEAAHYCKSTAVLGRDIEIPPPPFAWCTPLRHTSRIGCTRLNENLVPLETKNTTQPTQR